MLVGSQVATSSVHNTLLLLIIVCLCILMLKMRYLISAMCFWTKFHVSISQASPAGRVFVSTTPWCCQWATSAVQWDTACWRVLAAPECCHRPRVLREAHTDIDITCICGAASSAAAVSHSWLGEAPGQLATVYSFLRIHRVRAKLGDELLPSCHLFTWHMPCVCVRQ